jgi:hypothetical protein
MKLDASNVATILVLVYAVLGAVLVLLSAAVHVDPKLALSFADYLGQMAIATGGLAIGRGLAARKR